jgi:hypothetical protein
LSQAIAGFSFGAVNERNKMNISYKTLNSVRPEWADETPTALRPATSAAFRAVQEIEFERLKTRLLRRELAEATTPGLTAPVQRAANDAAALAWETTLPLLVFPVLFEEITAAAVRQSSRQARIYAGNELATV